MTYQQAAIPVVDPATFGAVRERVSNAFAASQVNEFMRSLERASMRIREFEAVLEKGLLGGETAAAYSQLTDGDQGQIRELYLASLEQVAPELRSRYFKLYAYY